MLKPITIKHLGQEITLECTHKRIFPPPQMYGATDADIDNLWRQGVLSQTEFQQLETWRRICHQMIMGPRCMDCPLALKQNPRPGRPYIIETEPWLPAKEKMKWDVRLRQKPEEKSKQEHDSNDFEVSEPETSPGDD